MILPAAQKTARVSDTIFIIGPGRSGTTLLYKLLCMHPEVAYISSLENRLPWLPLMLAGRVRVRSYAGKLKHWFLKSGNAYLDHRHGLNKLLPTPSEGERLYRYHGLAANLDDVDKLATFDAGPLRNAFRGLREAAGASLLISKRTANNRRLQILKEAFPGAAFISLRRDGRDVAASLSNVAWWDDHPLWWDPQHRTPREVSEGGEEMLRLCARNWVEESDAIDRGLADIEPSRVLEVQFEQVIESPVEEMRRLLEFAGLQTSPPYEDAVASLGLHAKPGVRHSAWSAEQLAMVNQELGAQLARQGYAI